MAGDAMRRVRRDEGVEIVVWSTGQGPALLLVHGTTADHSRWDTVLPDLGVRFTVYTIDRRGRGQSGDADPYRVEAEFDDVAAVVDSIGRDVSVLGHSYGALCSLEAARRTSGITKLVLYEPPLGGAGAPDEAWLVQAQQEIDRGERDAVLVSFFSDVVGVPADQLSTLRELPVWQARLGTVPTIPREFRAAVAYQLDPSALSEVNIPVLLLRGRHGLVRRADRSTRSCAFPRPHHRHAGPATRRYGHRQAAVPTRSVRVSQRTALTRSREPSSRGDQP